MKKTRKASKNMGTSTGINAGTSTGNNTNKKHNGDTEYLGGSIERVTFHNEENGFCVLKVKVRGQRDLVTVVGNAMSVTPGEFIDCSGQYVTNREYGLQFRADQLRVVLPSTLEGIEKYLGSGLVKGIGPQFAKRLIKAFGEQVFDVIEKTPERLTEVPGIGAGRREKLINSWAEQKIISDIVVFLQSYGLGTQRAVRIYKTYGQQAIEKVRENPYRLALDIRGIGFKTADILAEKLGIPSQSLIRAEAGIRHVLQELCNNGNCAVYTEELIQKSVELLEIPEDIIQTALRKEISSRNLIADEINGRNAIYLATHYRAEVGIVEQINRLLKMPVPWREELNIEKAISWVEEKTNVALSKTQRLAAREALQNKLVIITGGPGVGKTTLVNSILKILRMKTRQILLCAPTGRAAKRLSESTGLEAKTLHRLLEFDPKSFGFRRTESYPLDADVLVIDEMSMVDLFMMHNLLKAIPDHCIVLFVGDADQLPAVGPGMILSNLIDSDILPCIRLTEIFRQAAQSEIIINAHRINKGYFPKLQHEPGVMTDFYFIETESNEEILEKLLHVVAERIPRRFKLDPIREVQVLVPMNRGGLGVRALNIELQKRLNPNSNRTPSISRFGWTFSVGDKVIQLVNNYDKEIFNGDIGFIREIDEEDALLRIEFEGRMVSVEVDELDELSLAYATSIHKSQGSEYPAVVIPISMQHYTLLERNLLYTGITRGKSLVVVIGQLKALGMAIRTVKSSQRLTNLVDRLMSSQATLAGIIK